MIELDYAALRATPVGTDPFPHLVVPDFVPPDSLRAVLADLPPLEPARLDPARRIATWARPRGHWCRSWRGPLCARRSRRDSGSTLPTRPTLLTLRGWTTIGTGTSTSIRAPSG